MEPACEGSVECIAEPGSDEKSERPPEMIIENIHHYEWNKKESQERELVRCGPELILQPAAS